MDAGLHVLCEKPITTSLEEANRLIEKARETKRVFFPCHN
jgi:predicted dehydrogenase